MRKLLDRFINHPATELSIMLLIVVSVVLLVVEVQFPGTAFALQLEVINDLITVVFVAELSIRYYVARKKRRFFRQYWIDIIAVIPWLRSLRFLRLLRLLRLFRFGVILSRRLGSVSAVFRGAVREYLIIGLFILIVVLAGGVGVQITETQHDHFTDLGDTFWWSVFTLVAGEPIGASPKSHLGRGFALVLMIAGLTLFAMFTGIVSALMVNRLRSMDMRNMEIDELHGHLIICGWNRSTMTLLEEFGRDRNLTSRGIVVVAEFDQEPDLSRVGVDPLHLYVVTGDYTQIETLERCNIAEADTAILLSDRSKERSSQDIDARTVLAAIVIERLNPGIFTSVELLNRENGAHLRMMGVEEIVVAEEYTGGLLALSTRNRGILRLIDELHTHEGNGFVKVEAPETMIGRTVADVAADLRHHHAAILVALSEPDGEGGTELLTNPAAGREIKADTMFVLIAEETPQL